MMQNLILCSCDKLTSFTRHVSDHRLKVKQTVWGSPLGFVFLNDFHVSSWNESRAAARPQSASGSLSVESPWHGQKCLQASCSAPAVHIHHVWSSLWFRVQNKSSPPPFRRSVHKIFYLTVSRFTAQTSNLHFVFMTKCFQKFLQVYFQSSLYVHVYIWFYVYDSFFLSAVTRRNLKSEYVYYMWSWCLLLKEQFKL